MASGPEVAVSVNTFGGELFCVDARKRDAILQVKEIIAASHPVSRLRQILICREEVMGNTALVQDFCSEGACTLDVTLVVNPLAEILEQLNEAGLTKDIAAVPTSEVQQKLADAASCTNVAALPVLAAQWFELLLENGLALTFLDPCKCLEPSDKHSPGLLCLSHDIECLHIGVDAHDFWILDLTTTDGTVSCYSAFDEDFGSAIGWKHNAKEDKTFSNLSEYFLSKAKQATDKKRKDEEHAILSQDGTCLVVQCMIEREGSEGFERKMVNPHFQDCTVLALKGKISEMTGIPVQKQKVFYVGKTLNDDRLLSDYAIKGGSTLNVVACS